eukprot:symbB.v1.2.029200.t1/scaffold3170.1/size62039/4
MTSSDVIMAKIKGVLNRRKIRSAEIFRFLDINGNGAISASELSRGQGLQPETKTTGSQRPRPRPAVNLSVSGHRFQCQLPGVGDAHGDGGAYTALLRSAAFKGQCISGWTDDEQEFEVCLGHRFNLGPHVAWHQPPDTTTTDAGFEQRYVGPEMEATLECRCAKERKESEPEACGRAQPAAHRPRGGAGQLPRGAAAAALRGRWTELYGEPKRGEAEGEGL